LFRIFTLQAPQHRSTAVYIFLLLFCCFKIEAQVITQVTNQKYIDSLLRFSSIVDVPNISLSELTDQEITALEAQDAQNDAKGDTPWRFAKTIVTNISIDNTGILQSTGNYWSWAVKLQTNNAKSLSLTFDHLNLSKGAEIYLFTNERTVLYGPLTSEAFLPTDEISTEVLPGNSIFVIYRVSTTT
jgi:hypothetical protein